MEFCAFAPVLPVNRTASSFQGSLSRSRRTSFSVHPRPAARALHANMSMERGVAMGAREQQAAALSALQNGSDIRGVASNIFGKEPNVTAGRVRAIVCSFARDVSRTLGRPVRVAIGRDSRISGPLLEKAAAAGVLDAGMQATVFGLATTPAMFMATVLGDEPFDAALVLTASHLPSDRNGIKFFTRNGSASSADIKRILDGSVGEKDEFADDAGLPDGVAQQDFMKVYAAHLVRLIQKGCNHPDSFDQPLKGMKFVVDAGNGAAGFFATDVLEKLGGDVSGQFLDPDGMFPNHVPNPENETAMAMTVESTVREKADLGVIFDTDGDRSGVVDDQGTAINRNRLIALLSKIVLRETPGSTIVTDSVTSNGLKQFIEDNGGKHFRYRKGYKNVIDKGIALHKAGTPTMLAIETSGHGAMRENYMLDDGAYLAVKIIIELVRLRLSGTASGLASLMDGLSEPLEETEFRLPFKNNATYKQTGQAVLEAFSKFAGTVEGWTPEAQNFEGLRVNVAEPGGKSGWLLLRRSLHDPILPLNVESETPGGTAAILRVLLERFFVNWENLDVSVLSEHVRAAPVQS